MNSSTNDTKNKQFLHISYILIILSIYAAGMHFYYGTIQSSLLNIAISLTILLLINLKLSLNIRISSLLFIGMIYFISLLYTGGLHHTGWLWSLTFAPIAAILLDKKRTIVWVVTYGSIIFCIFLMQLFFNLSSIYSSYEILTLLIIYIFNSYLLYLFKNKIDYYNSQLTKINIELKNKISQEVEANERKNKILHTQSKQAQMGEMVSMIAHQWRQPLNAISASAIKLKLENDLGVISSKSIDSTSIFIQERTQDMSEIINNFLDYSKSTNKNTNFSPTNIIDKTFNIINNQLSIRGIFLTLNYPDNSKDQKIYGVDNLLEQVLLNLLFNVRDAFDERKEIAIKNIYLTLDANSNITIEDNAGGIPAEIKDKVFNPYFTTKEEGKGTGLGLYMSRKILRDNFNGDLIYKPVEDGSSFTIIFNTNEDLSLKEEDEY